MSPANGLAVGRKEHSLGKARVSSLYTMQTEVMDVLGNTDTVYLSVDLKACNPRLQSQWQLAVHWAVKMASLWGGSVACTNDLRLQRKQR